MPLVLELMARCDSCRLQQRVALPLLGGSFSQPNPEYESNYEGAHKAWRLPHADNLPINGVLTPGQVLCPECLKKATEAAGD